jgi:hypothetical protein
MVPIRTPVKARRRSQRSSSANSKACRISRRPRPEISPQRSASLGDRLGHVKDFSRDDPLARAYRNKQELSPHTDSADLVGLVCLRSAKSGGVSRLTSALTIHNVMLEEYPEALERLYRGYIFHRRGEEKPGDLPYTPCRVLVYSNTEGKVSARYVRTYVEAGEATAGRPMGEEGLAALDRFEEVTKRPELNSHCGPARCTSSTTTRSSMLALRSTMATPRRTGGGTCCAYGSKSPGRGPFTPISGATASRRCPVERRPTTGAS